MKGIHFFQTIQTKLIIIYVLLILVATQLIGIYFIKTMEESFSSNFTASLNKQVNLLTEIVKPYLQGSSQSKEEGKRTYDDLNDVVNNFNKISGAEIQVIDANGVVLSTSLNVTARNGETEIKNTQAEVSQALQGFKGIEWDVVDSSGVRKKAMATPVIVEGKVLGAVYIVASMEDLFSTINRIKQIFIAGTLIALALTGMLGILLSGTITYPIKAITKNATAIANGNFNQKVKIFSQDEIGQLGYAFNHMTNRLKEALSANEEEKEKLASILTNMSDGVIAADDRGKVIVMNRRAGQILQASEQDVMGKAIPEVLGLTSNRIGRHWSRQEQSFLMNYQSGEGTERLKILVKCTPIQRRESGITGLIVVLQDVTQQEKMEQSRKEFVANVSHELRTPLTAIKSYQEALEDGALDDPQLSRRFLGVIRHETERMIRLVTDLLQLSRLDNQQAVISKEITDVSEMLEEVADRFSFQMKSKSIRIEVHVDPQVQNGWFDPDQIDQVLDNLVSNAIKYTQEGGKIRLEAYMKDHQWVEIAVKDSGAGIPKKELHRIFERFYRVDKARSRSMGGTGLGLSIAREIIKAHGGTISLQSELNQGTEVSFTVPLAKETGSDAI